VYICVYIIYVHICCIYVACKSVRRFHCGEDRRPRTAGSASSPPSAYVSIRQHTSAYVSIRQHTSAYVSIWRPRTAGSASCSAVSVCTFVLVSKYFCTSKAISTCEKSGTFELLSRHYLYSCTSTASILVRKLRTFWPRATEFIVYMYT
jgi:hypothetical protein